ncbi:MAG: zf-HC2 domain-containing protein [Desulfobacteraceae bacterium]|nr:zf-HC2 domain-containing protein [Desulfobacteraceae bacterium]
MKRACKIYDEKTIGEFIDNELSSEKNKAIAEHIETCPICHNIATNYQHLSDVFIKSTSDKLDQIDTKLLGQNVLEQIKRKETGFFKKVFDYFSPKIYLKVASVVVIMIASFIYFQERPLNSIDSIGSSAVVNSVDGDVSSVMIFETEKSKHTIIWFSEA